MVWAKYSLLKTTWTLLTTWTLRILESMLGLKYSHTRGPLPPNAAIPCSGPDILDNQGP